MPKVIFTANIQRHVPCPTRTVPGSTVAEVFNALFAENSPARDYVLDDQGAVRKNIAVFINGHLLVDRTKLSDTITDDGEIYIMQALSGG
jgi:sulfur-carrier protein